MELPITPIILGLIPINPIILGLKVNMDGWQIKLNMMGMEDGDGHEVPLVPTPSASWAHGARFAMGGRP